MHKNTFQVSADQGRSLWLLSWVLVQLMMSLQSVVITLNDIHLVIIIPHHHHQCQHHLQ